MRKLMIVTASLFALSACEIAEINQAKKYADNFENCRYSHPAKVGMSFEEIVATCLGQPTKINSHHGVNNDIIQAIWYPRGSYGNPDPRNFQRPYDIGEGHFFAYFDRSGRLISFDD